MPNDDTVTIDGNGDFTLDLHPSRHQEHHIHIVRKGDMTIVTFGTDDRRVFFHPNVPYVFRFEGTCVSHDMGLMSVSYDNDDQVSFDVHGIRSISRPQSFHHGSRQQEL